MRGIPCLFINSMLTKSISFSLAIALCSASFSPVVAGYDDRSRSYQPRDYNNSYNHSSNYSPPSRLDLQVQNLNSVLAMRNMVPKPATIAPLPANPIFTPVIKFEPTKLDLKREVPQAVKPVQSMPKPQGFLAKVEGVLKGLGKAVAAPFQAIARAVAKFFKSPEATKASPSQMDVARQFTNLQPMGQGVFETRGGRTYALGMSWEQGSQFKVEGDQLKLISGTAEDKGFGPIKREDGTLLPVKFVGGKDGITPVGIDFSHLEPNARLIVTAPLEIQGLGSIQPGKMVFRGYQTTPTGISGRFDFEGGQIQLEKNAAHGFGLESPTTLAHASFTLQAGLMRLNSALVQNGDKRVHLEQGRPPIDVGKLEQRVKEGRSEANELTSQASKAALDVENSVRVANSLMDNIENQTGTSFPSRFEPKGAVKALETASQSVKAEGEAVQTALNARDYGKAEDIQTTLEAKQGDLAQKTEEVTQAGESFKKFQQSLRGLTVAMKALSGKADLKNPVAPLDPLSEEFLKRAHMGEAKQDIAGHKEAGFTALEEMAAQGIISAEEAQSFASTLSNAATRLTVARPRTMANDVAEMAHEVLTYPISSTRRDLARSEDVAFFNPLGSLSDTHPNVTQVIGTVGYYGSKSALLGSQLVGVGLMGYFIAIAPLATGGMVATQLAAEKTLTALGVPEETAQVASLATGFYAGVKLGSSPRIQKADGTITSGAKSLWARTLDRLGLSQRPPVDVFAVGTPLPSGALAGDGPGTPPALLYRETGKTTITRTNKTTSGTEARTFRAGENLPDGRIPAWGRACYSIGEGNCKGRTSWSYITKADNIGRIC